jgi:hypothetical protein
MSGVFHDDAYISDIGYIRQRVFFIFGNFLRAVIPRPSRPPPCPAHKNHRWSDLVPADFAGRIGDCLSR